MKIILNFLLLSYLIVKTLTISRKCPGLKWDMEIQKELKMGIQIGSKSIRILKDDISKIKDIRNYRSKYIFAKDTSWIFVNGRPISNIKVDRNEINENNLDINYDGLKNLMSYESVFNTTIMNDCYTIHNLVDRAIFLFFELFISQFKNLQIKGKDDGVLLENPFNHYRGFKKITKENFNSKYEDLTIMQNFLVMIDNELSLEKIKTFENYKINKFLRELVQNQNLADIFNLENKQLKNDLMENIGKYLSYYADVPKLNLFFQMPTENFVGFYKKIVEEGILDDEDELFVNNFLNNFKNVPSKCKDKGIFKKDLCIVLTDLNIEGKRISTMVISFSVLIMNFLHGLFFDPKGPLSYQKNQRGLRKNLHIQSQSSLKSVFFHFNKIDREIFTKIWSKDNFYQNDYVLMSYDDHHGNKIDNSKITAKEYINSLLSTSGSTGLLYEALQKSPDDIIRYNKVPRDCDHCIIINLDTFNTFNLIEKDHLQGVVNSSLRFENIGGVIKNQAEWFFSMKKERVIFEENIN